MKRIIMLILSLCILCLYTSAALLSPGMDIIKSRLCVAKSAAAGSEIKFKAEDFERALGVKKLDRIVILSLPPACDGILSSGGRALSEGQSISRENISMLAFEPAEKGSLTTSFTFKLEGNSDEMGVLCKISLTDGVNFAPSAEKKTAKTYRYVSLHDKLSSFDADGDELVYEIVSAPEKGVLTLTNEQRGNFVYTPRGDYTGTDSFEYRVRDCFGNLSETKTVKIKIEGGENCYFEDMVSHWAHAPAISAVRLGIIDSSPECFEPEATVSRGEFLIWTMRALSLEPSKNASLDVFADVGSMSGELLSYLAAASSMGAVKGYEVDSALYFMPDEPITRAQACVIVNSLADLKPQGDASAFVFADSMAVFADVDSVPEWAREAMYNLVACNIISGSDDYRLEPEKLISRAQAAKLLCDVRERTE